jgi:hypothetical protein
MFMHLDVMVTKDFLLKEGDKFAMVLAPTLNLDGTPDTGYYTPVIIFLLHLSKNYIPLVVPNFWVMDDVIARIFFSVYSPT